jgi:hypothetical protein
MGPREPAEAGITRRLQEAIDRLQADVKRVEIWAGALSGFLQPVPEYDADTRRLPAHDEHRAQALTQPPWSGPGQRKRGGIQA